MGCELDYSEGAYADLLFDAVVAEFVWGLDHRLGLFVKLIRGVIEVWVISLVVLEIN